MYIIESNNSYFNVGLKEILKELKMGYRVCIIDLETAHSVNSLLRCLRINRRCRGFVFIGGEGLYSQVFSELIDIDCKCTEKDFINQIKLKPAISSETAINVLHNIKTMAVFTSTEKSTVYSLIKNTSLSDAAMFTGTPNKQFYKRVNAVARKLHLKNRFNVQCFIQREFIPCDIGEYISEPTRQLVCL